MHEDLHYELHGGTGIPLLLVHGMLASRAQWTPNLDSLARVSRPVVVELLGHGRSPSPEDPGAYRPERYVDAFERIRAELGAERWFVCGQSLGAALTLRYALEHPERVVAQVFTNSNSALAESGWRDRVLPPMKALAERLQQEGIGSLEALPIHPARSRRIPPEVREALVSDCALHHPRGIALTGLHTVPESSVRERVTKTRIPSLLVVGERETRFAEHRTYAEKTIPGLEVVPVDSGHAVNIEAAEAFNAAVARFVVKYSTQASAERNGELITRRAP